MQRKCKQRVARPLAGMLFENIGRSFDIGISEITLRIWLINKFALDLCSKPYQPFQSPGYRSPEGQVWNRLLHNGCTDQHDSVSS